MKYRLRTDLKKEVNGVTLFRIECVTAFASIDSGELGGWIEKEENLSQYGNAWVYGDAEVYGNARVYGNAEVYGNARVSGNADIFLIKLSARFLTFCKDKKIGISVTVGCQQAISLDDFKNRIFEDGGYTEKDLPKHRREYLKAIELVEEFMQIEKKEGE